MSRAAPLFTAKWPPACSPMSPTADGEQSRGGPWRGPDLNRRPRAYEAALPRCEGLGLRLKAHLGGPNPCGVMRQPFALRPATGSAAYIRWSGGRNRSRVLGECLFGDFEALGLHIEVRQFGAHRLGFGLDLGKLALEDRLCSE